MSVCIFVLEFFGRISVNSIYITQNCIIESIFRVILAKIHAPFLFVFSQFWLYNNFSLILVSFGRMRVLCV